MSKRQVASTTNALKGGTKVKQSTLMPLKTDFYVRELPAPADYASRPTWKIGHWNINGLRAVLAKDSFTSYVREAQLDIICFNETKIDKAKLLAAGIEKHALFDGYHQYWSFSTRKLGYSGAAILSKPKPLSYTFGVGQELFDLEGRTVTVEYEDFYLIAVYVPNAGPGCSRLDEKTRVWNTAFQAHIDGLRAKKDVMVLGDINVAHNPIDLHDPKGNEGVNGYTKEERGDFTSWLAKGYKDAFRELYPDAVKYTWFSARTKTARPNNKGWRIDYCVVSDAILQRVESVVVRDDVHGSDHVPVEVCWRNVVEGGKAVEAEAKSEEAGDKQGDTAADTQQDMHADVQMDEQPAKVDMDVEAAHSNVEHTPHDAQQDTPIAEQPQQPNSQNKE